MKEKLLELKKNLLKIGLTTAAISLVSCEEAEKYSRIKDTTEYQSISFDIASEKQEAKTFKVGEHKLYVIEKETDLDIIKNNVIQNTPNGYEICDIIPLTKQNNYGKIIGYLIYFTNNRKVEVPITSLYQKSNDKIEERFCYVFGTVIESQYDEEKNSVNYKEEKFDETIRKNGKYNCSAYDHRISFMINNSDLEAVKDKVINDTPDGYEVYEIYPVTKRYGYNDEIIGYEVSLTNNREVELITTAIYHEETRQIELGYYTFGSVVKKEKSSNENVNATLKG